MQAFTAHGREAFGKPVVAREIEVDDRIAADRIRLVSQAGLKNLGGNDPGFDEKKETDLHHVRARRDVNQIVLFIRVERIVPGEVEQFLINAFEIPGLGEDRLMKPDRRFGRDLPEVGGQLVAERTVFVLYQQLESVDEQILMLADRDGGTPFLPAVPGAAGIQNGTGKTDDDGGFSHDCAA